MQSLMTLVQIIPVLKLFYNSENIIVLHFYVDLLFNFNFFFVILQVTVSQICLFIITIYLLLMLMLISILCYVII